jgi:hypothetical protein
MIKITVKSYHHQMASSFVVSHDILVDMLVVVVVVVLVIMVVTWFRNTLVWKDW